MTAITGAAVAARALQALQVRAADDGGEIFKARAAALKQLSYENVMPSVVAPHSNLSKQQESRHESCR